MLWRGWCHVDEAGARCPPCLAAANDETNKLTIENLRDFLWRVEVEDD